MAGFDIMNGMGGGGMPQMGGPPQMLGGGMIPGNLLSQIQPSPNPQQAIGGMGGMDPRILAYIKALGGGGMMGGMR